MKNPFWIVNETRQGFSDAGYDYAQPVAQIERSVKLGLASGFRIWNWPPTKELINEIIEKAGFVMVDFWIGTAMNNHWMKIAGKNEEDFYDYHINLLKAAADKYGDRFFWTITGEPDSQQPNWPVEKFATRKEAYRFFMEWLKGFAPAMDYKTKLRWHSYLKKKKVNLKKHNVAIHLGYPMPAHYSYEMGVRMVWVECNCFLPTGVQPTVAFLRGAANQFRASKTYWGIDFAPWNDMAMISKKYDETGRRLGGTTESLFLRECIYGYLSGANILLQESSDLTHWIWSPRPYSRLSKTGKAAARFGKFAKSFDRGRPYRSVAVMLEHDHGWLSSKDDGGTNQVWFGTIPVGKADLTISHFFDLAFPGHLDYFKGYGELYCRQPWRKISDFREMVKSGTDMRPHEKGRLAASRWGDAIDVVLENCPDDVLSNYKVIVLLGGLKVNARLAKKLETFVRKGGTVVANVTNFFNCPEELLESRISHGTQGKAGSIPSKRKGKVSPAVEKLLGFNFTSVKSAAGISCYLPADISMTEDGFTFEKVELTAARPLATAPNYIYMDPHNTPLEHLPLAVERKLGRGRFITTLAYYMMQPAYRTPLNITKYIYDYAISGTLPFQIEGPAVQYLFNKVKGGWLVSIFNNGRKYWKGCIVSAKKPSSTSIEWGKAGNLKWRRQRGSWKLKVSVPAFKCKIVKILI